MALALLGLVASGPALAKRGRGRRWGGGGRGGWGGGSSGGAGGGSGPIDWDPITSAAGTAAKFVLGIPAALASCGAVWGSAGSKGAGLFGFGLAALLATVIVRHFYLDSSPLGPIHPLFVAAALALCLGIDMVLNRRARRRQVAADAQRLANAAAKARADAALASLVPCTRCGVQLMGVEDRCPVCGTPVTRHRDQAHAGPAAQHTAAANARLAR